MASMARRSRLKPLTGDSLQAFAVTSSRSPKFASEAENQHPGAPVPPSPASIAAGKRSTRTWSASCHGTDGGGTDAIASGMVDDWGYSTEPVSMTEP
jgi:hypothetical protein